MTQTARLPHARFRTAVGNGKTNFLTNRELAHTIRGRRWNELYAQGVIDLGGDLSMAEDSILQMAVTLTVDCQMAQIRLLTDEPFDATKFSTNANAARRLYETLGIKRTQKDITTSLQDYLAQQPDEPPAHPLATDDGEELEAEASDISDAEEADNSTPDPESVE